MSHVNLADAKARLSELVELAATGERIVITRRGKPVVEMSKPEVELQPVDTKALRDLTRRLPRQERVAGTALRRLRDDSRY
jgi:antitoxin (DNA-binding transcriptional repressor) of toxin-antitoxin stability system